LDYYGVTFDHLVPPDDEDPMTLQILIAETENDNALYAKTNFRIQINAEDYTPYRKRVFANYRCCSIGEGTGDRMRINSDVQRRESPNPYH
jgi:hypothetical protein